MDSNYFGSIYGAISITDYKEHKISCQELPIFIVTNFLQEFNSLLYQKKHGLMTLESGILIPF